jgi:uncharacterized protein YcbX
MNQTMIVTGIWIYPVKSLGGIRLQHAKVLPKGLEYDRRWMLIDSDNRFMTQRICPKMALMKMSMAEDGFIMRFGDEERLLGLTHSHEPIQSIVWDDPVIVYEVDSVLSDWISECLNFKCRLVFFPEKEIRNVEPDFATGGEQVSLADAYPLLVVGETTLEDLNDKLASPVPMDRFRPNITFSGGRPFQEDEWGEFNIGDSSFKGVKPCGRCIMTTINQETADKGREPLHTLATYRTQKGKVRFGQNLLVLKTGEIKIGDHIQLPTE